MGDQLVEGPKSPRVRMDLCNQPLGQSFSFVGHVRNLQKAKAILDTVWEALLER